MKKAMVALVLPVILFLSSCGNSGPEADAEKICEMKKDWKKAKDAGRIEEADKIEMEGRKLIKEMRNKYKEDEKAQKKFSEKLAACEEEVEN